MKLQLTLQFQPGNPENPVSLVTAQHLDDFVPPSKTQPAGVVPWAPPLTNWNAWTGCNFEEGDHFSNVNFNEFRYILLKIIFYN